MKQVMQFFKEVRVELSKVEWPKPDEFLGALVITLLFMTFFAIFLGSVDRIISWLAQKVF